MAKDKTETDSGALPSAQPAVVPEALMYLGPTLISPVPLTHRSVFSGGTPEFARELLQKDPELTACFVPLKEAGKGMRELEGALPAGELTRHYTGVQKRYARTK